MIYLEIEYGMIRLSNVNSLLMQLFRNCEIGLPKNIGDLYRDTKGIRPTANGKYLLLQKITVRNTPSPLSF